VTTPNEPNEQKAGTQCNPETVVTAKRSATLSYMSLPKHKTTDNPDLRAQAKAGQPCFKRTSKVVFNYPAKLYHSLPAASFIYPEQPTVDADHIPAFNYD